MSRKSKPAPKLYATAGDYMVNGAQRKDTFTQIYESAVRSEAFRSLPAHVQMLYIYTRLQEMGKRKPDRDYSEEHPMRDKVKGDDCFYFPRSTAAQYANRYKSTSHRLYDDMGILEEHGFIDTVISGRNNRKKSVYKYSERWKDYKPDTTAKPAAAEPETESHE